ncbi:MAG: hypothetical protein QM742_10025 [Aquabacterium sp.]
MSSQGEMASGACPQCGAANGLRVGQLIRQGKLRWYETVNCDSCNMRSESDGIGIAPQSLREKLIASNGVWQVKVNEPKSTTTVAKVVRDALALEMKEAVQMAKGLPGVVYTGTKSEANWLIDLLEKSGEQALLQEA